MQEEVATACRELWPEKRALSLENAITNLAHSLTAEWRKLETRKQLQQHLQAAAAVPLIGVLGLLNAGKSSLVASFLKNPERVLRGLAGNEGTQRFVLWLPRQWQEEPLFGMLQGELQATFGHEGALLSEDPLEAHQQYRGQGNVADLFAVPLLAFDEGLESFGLIDCPDFQRPHPGAPAGADPTAPRREFVEKAARLMSATVVIAERAKVATADFQHFLGFEGLKGKPRFLLLNYLRPATDVEALLDDEEVRSAMEKLGVRSLAIAYDYNMHGAAEKIPGHGTDSPAPVFFEVPPADPPRLIHEALQELDPGELWKNRLATEAQQLRDDERQLLNALEHELREQRKGLEATRGEVMQFIKEVMTVEEGKMRGGLKCPITGEVARQLVEGILREAPWWAQPTIRLYFGLSNVKGWIGKATDQIKTVFHPSAKAKNVIHEMHGRFRDSSAAGISFLSATHLTSRSRNLRWMPEGVDEERLKLAWDTVVDHLEKTSGQAHFEFDSEALSKGAKELWNSIPTLKRLSLAATGPMIFLLGLVAVMLVPFDGGTTILLGASLPELIAVFGISGGATHLLAGRLERDLLEKMAVPFYRRLLGIALDVFGLPRPGPEVRHSFAGVGDVPFPLPGDEKVALEEPVLSLREGRSLAEVLPEAYQKLEGGK